MHQRPSSTISTIGFLRLRTRLRSSRSRSSPCLGIFGSLSVERSQNSAVISVPNVTRLFSTEIDFDTMTRFSRASISCSRRSVTVLPAADHPAQSDQITVINRLFDVLEQLAVMRRLVEADSTRRACQAVELHHLSAHARRPLPVAAAHGRGNSRARR